MIIIDNLRAFDVIRVHPNLYRIVAVFATGPDTWCAFESFTTYEARCSDVKELIHIGRPLSRSESLYIFNFTSYDAYLEFSKSLGQYSSLPDKILLAV